MVTLARKRLARAEHFLDLAQQHAVDRERFLIYFETFAVYARSVLNVLKEEVDAAGVFTCFEPEWKTLGTEALPEFFRGARNIVLKEGVEGAGTRGEFVLNAEPGAYTLEGYDLAMEIHRADGTAEVEKRAAREPTQSPVVESKVASTAGASARYFLRGGPFANQEVFGVCQQYLTRLAQAIRVAENCGA